MQSFLLFLLSAIDVCLVWKWLTLWHSHGQTEQAFHALGKQMESGQQRIRELEFRRDCLTALLEGESVLEVACRSLQHSRCDNAGSKAIAIHVVLERDAALLTEFCGFAEDEIQLTRINYQSLSAWSRLKLTAGDLRSGDPVRLPSHLLPGLEGLHILRHRDDTGAETVLLLSNLPEITGNEQFDQELFLECLSVRTKYSEARVTPSLNEEVRLVKEMLELRTLTDVEFQSPSDMLSEFLGKLCQFCNFERGALYLNQTRQGQWQPELTAQGGQGLDRSRFSEWLKAEQRIITSRLHSRDILFLGRETFLESEAPPFHSGLLLPLVRGSESLGQLVLTGYQINRPTAADLQLAKWGAEYLLNTMIKTAQRVRIEDQARRDPLTQLANRQAFDEVLKRSIRYATGHDAEPCALILLDLDHFKSINDTYGHLAGDAVLKQAAQIIQNVSHSRVTDQPLVARYGGEEMAVILPNVGEPGATRIAEAIREALHSSPAVYEGIEIRITTSGGLAVCPWHGTTAETLIAAADLALYRAKRMGRNRIEVASSAVTANHAS